MTATVDTIYGHKVERIGEYNGDEVYITDEPDLYYALYSDMGWVKVAKSDSIDNLKKELDRIRGRI